MLPIPRRIKGVVVILAFLLSTCSVGYCQTLRDLYESAVDLYNKGQYDESIAVYQKIIKDVPQFAPSYIGLGLALKAKGGDVEEVVYYYKMAVEKDPTNAQALEQLGRLYYSLGQMNKAKGAFERVLKINPNVPSVSQTLGWICLVGRSTNPKKAIRYFEDVIKVDQNPNAYFGLGIAYFSDNQREKVFDVITQLKAMEQNEFAEKLEKAVRENRKVILDEPSDVSDSSEDKDFEKTPDAPRGIKVRLRGKLDELPSL